MRFLSRLSIGWAVRSTPGWMPGWRRRPGPAAPAPRAPKQFSPLAMALGSIALGIPITAIVVSAGAHPAGIWGLLVVWIAIAAINLGYAAKLRQPGDRH